MRQQIDLLVRALSASRLHHLLQLRPAIAEMRPLELERLELQEEVEGGCVRQGGGVAVAVEGAGGPQQVRRANVNPASCSECGKLLCQRDAVHSELS